MQNFVAAIRDLVALVDTSATDSDFDLAHVRIRAARGVYEVAQVALKLHQLEPRCWTANTRSLMAGQRAPLSIGAGGGVCKPNVVAAFVTTRFSRSIALSLTPVFKATPLCFVPLRGGFAGPDTVSASRPSQLGPRLNPPWAATTTNTQGREALQTGTWPPSTSRIHAPKVAEHRCPANTNEMLASASMRQGY